MYMEGMVQRDKVVRKDVDIFSAPVEVCRTSGHMNEVVNQISIEVRIPSRTSSGMRKEEFLLVNYILGISTDEVEEVLLPYCDEPALSLHSLTTS